MSFGIMAEPSSEIDTLIIAMNAFNINEVGIAFLDTLEHIHVSSC